MSFYWHSFLIICCKCDTGHFGYNCAHRCHCKQEPGWKCDRFEGNCSHGCVIGWMGFNCSIDTSIVTPKTRVEQSSVHSSAYKPMRLVDGRLQAGALEQVYETCTATGRSQIPWIEVDLGGKYLIQFIRMYGRTDRQAFEQALNLQIFVDNNTMQDPAANNGTYVTTENITIPSNEVTITIDPPRIVQYIIIRRWTPSIITLCEVKVYKTDCDIMSYGDKCASTCNCADDKHCHVITGICQTPGCKSGWEGDACNKACHQNMFGRDCSSACHCENAADCNRMSGTCWPGECARGWQGGNCSHANSMFETMCNEGMFGSGCNSTCHCQVNTDCNHINGSCTPGGCTQGWRGLNCSQAYSLDDDDKGGDGAGASAGMITGFAVGIVVLLVLVAAVILYRTRAMQQTTTEEPLPLAKGSPDVTTKLSVDQPLTKQLADDVDHANEYYNTDTVVRGIKITSLWTYVKDRTKERSDEFDKEFTKLRSGLQYPHSVGGKPELKTKNRYKDMYAYDHSRVVLQTESPDETDYINACYIDGYATLKKFIASQGPTKAMINDFWRMAWQENSNKIVMLTKLVEMGTQKCIQYWPEQVGETESYLNIHVKLINEETLQDYIIRDLEVNKGNSAHRTIHQYHFMAWPDKDVPDNAWCLVDFWRTVDTSDTTSDKPIVVHCSAGVGRTGTFIAMDNLVEQARVEGCVRPLQIVETLRKQRLNMVQTRNQYAYMHEALTEALLIGTHYVDFKHFENVYKYMANIDATGDKIAEQLRLIDESENGTTEGEDVDTVEYSNIAEQTSTSKCNVKCGKLQDVSPQLSSYLVPDYIGKDTIIICKSPTKNTLTDFLELIIKQHIITVIMVTASATVHHKTAGNIGEGECGNYHVEIAKEKTHGASVKEKTLHISDVKQQDGDHTKIKQFEFTAWDQSAQAPQDIQSMLELLDAVQRWQPDLLGSKPVLIHCIDGSRQSGVVAVLLNELQRMRIGDGNINLVETVFTMKQRNTGIIQSKEQLRYCYDVIFAHIGRMTEIYQNL